MKTIAQKTLMRFIISISLIVIGTSFYLQYLRGMEPCPLCLMQRLCVIFILILGILNLAIPKLIRNKKIVISQLFFGIIGFYFAARQLWLVSLPHDQIPACVPGLTILIHYFPWKDVAHALFWGSGDCTEITWSWLGISLPMWAAIYFVTIISANIAVLREMRQK